MNIVKNEKGITLIALVITIIILLILAGVTLIIANNLIIEKAIVAHNETTEAILQERIQLAWSETQVSYMENARNKGDINKSNYVKSNFAENLLKLEDFSEVNITEGNDGNITVDFKYKNKSYSFLVTSAGKAEQLQLLKGNVKVGDYIEYPIEYCDMYTEEHYTAQNGWMVIDDGVMPGTSGVVRITSTNIPAKWYYASALYADNIAAEQALLNDFENLDLVHNAETAEADDLGINQSIKGSYFKVSPIAQKVAALSISDLNYAYNAFYGANRASDDISTFGDKEDLFHIRDPGAYYWLATRNKNSTTNLHYITFYGIKEEAADMRLGVKPVIYLSENQVGILKSNVWKMIY